VIARATGSMTTRLRSPETPSVQATSLPMMNCVVSLIDVPSRLSALPTSNDRPVAPARHPLWAASPTTPDYKPADLIGLPQARSSRPPRARLPVRYRCGRDGRQLRSGRRPAISSLSGDCCSSPTIRKSAAPPRSNATACTANEPRRRCPGCCSARPLSDNGQPRERRRLCTPRGQSRSSGTAPGAPDRRDRRVAKALVFANLRAWRPISGQAARTNRSSSAPARRGTTGTSPN
jgi:hypothetical protein